MAPTSTPLLATRSPTSSARRRFPIGAEPQPGGGVHFRVWAPQSRTAAIELSGRRDPSEPSPLNAERGGYFSGFLPQARVGSHYRIQLDHGSFPDPASRRQPEGPHGPSEVVDPHAFRWTDLHWRGAAQRGQVIYELHLGTFTAAGTWRGALERLPHLRDLGVTMLEVMPIAEFPGRWGWGYDGVDLFAPSHLYGEPDDAREFVNRAHTLGLAVILDVVYNHIGPDGNYLAQFARDYFSTTKKTEWGDALNFNGLGNGPVREFFVTNACYWIDEFHFDGLRLDATQQIFDDSPQHIVAEIAAAARAVASPRAVYLVAENEPQETRIVRQPERGGFGLDAIWNDDFHHTAQVAATGRAEAYYGSHRGVAQEFVSALKHGFLYQGQGYRWQRKRRGSPAFDIPAHQFVVFLQNHDQVANSLRGERLHVSIHPARWRALTAVLLLGPQTPLLFQGQEFAASSPFLYFTDHHPELQQLVSQGRRASLDQFPSVACPECRDVLAEPGASATFERSKLDWSECEQHAAALRLHRDLLQLRATTSSIAAPAHVDGAVLSAHAFVLRYFSASADDRLLLVNLGADLELRAAPEPLLAPPEHHGWSQCWSSESPGYGGNGTPPVETSAGWWLPADTAVLLEPGDLQDLPAPREHEGA